MEAPQTPPLTDGLLRKSLYSNRLDVVIKLSVEPSDDYLHRDKLRHLQHPFQEYTIGSHGKSHNVVYQTARTDLLDLNARRVLEQKKRGKKMIFTVPPDLADRLKGLGK